MQRLTKPCKNTENGKYIRYTVGSFTGIYPDCDFGKVVERLAYYEDLEEQDRLLILQENNLHPCMGCDVGWGSISSEGCTSCEETCERFKRYVEEQL